MHVFFKVRRRRAMRSGLCGVFIILLWLLPWHVSLAESADTAVTLTEATRRAIHNNPELRVFKWRLQAVEGQRQSAGLAPAYALELGAENLLGSGDYSGTDQMELTLSLSSVIELGGQRRSRVVVADARHALVDAEREAAALDLLGAVTQRFIAALALQEKRKVAEDATALSATAYQLVSERVERGAAPEVERLRARAALAQARLRQQALESEAHSRRLALAVSWGAEQAEFAILSGNLFQFDESAAFDALYRRVVDSPALTVLAREERLRDAEVELARSQSASNVEWSLGVRRFADSSDSALTAGISIPLYSGRRNQGEIATARALRSEVDDRRESTLLALRARLFDAWKTHRQSVAAARQIRTDILPTLEQALAQTRQAYERGRYGYVDWISAQQELLDARLALIDAAATALLNQALIEQLTAQPLTADPANPPF